MHVKRKFYAGGNDGEWIRRCRVFGVNPKGIFKASLKSGNWADGYLVIQLSSGFHWRGSTKFFIKDSSRVKSLEDS